MKPRITRDIVLDALLMAVWRRNPSKRVIVHSDQGSQYTSHDWRSFIRDNKLDISMSRRGNCHDNAVAESFFQLLKRERIKRKVYTTRMDARAGVFDSIEMFYNRKRRHGFNNRLSPVVFEERFINGSKVSNVSGAIHYLRSDWLPSRRMCLSLFLMRSFCSPKLSDDLELFRNS